MRAIVDHEDRRGVKPDPFLLYLVGFLLTNFGLTLVVQEAIDLDCIPIRSGLGSDTASCLPLNSVGKVITGRAGSSINRAQGECGRGETGGGYGDEVADADGDVVLGGGRRR